MALEITEKETHVVLISLLFYFYFISFLLLILVIVLVQLLFTIKNGKMSLVCYFILETCLVPFHFCICKPLFHNGLPEYCFFLTFELFWTFYQDLMKVFCVTIATIVWSIYKTKVCHKHLEIMYSRELMDIWYGTKHIWSVTVSCWSIFHLHKNEEDKRSY